MKSSKGFLVLESGETFSGLWQGGASTLDGASALGGASTLGGASKSPNHRAVDRAGEVVFNTSHGGYEEMATDPSYLNQILVLTAPQQGNYGENDEFWESERIWIDGVVCVEMQNSWRDKRWQEKLLRHQVPILTDVDTRKLVFRLRDQGTPWGALVRAETAEEATQKSKTLIAEKKKLDKDWAHFASVKEERILKGDNPRGPKIAVLDFGCKSNSLRELKVRCSEVKIFPSRSSAQRIREYNPDGILLTNGPGDPGDVRVAPETLKELIGWKFIFGICMGHQVLGRALGGETYKLKFGHRGSNHPIKDSLLNRIYMSSQNHGYAVKLETLPKTVQVTHVNLNDNTVAGIYDPSRKALSVQFHPESHPGPHEASELFDFFIRQTQ